MKKHDHVLTVLCAAGMLAACSHPQEVTKLKVSGTLQSTPRSAGTHDKSTMLHEAVNAFRSQQSLAPLQRHAGLDRLAMQHSEYLRKNRGKFSLYGKNVSHNGSEGRFLMARQLYRMENLSENVASCSAAGTNPSGRLISLWSQSPDHFYNLKSNWSHTGIGVVVDSDGTVFATQLFANITQSQMLMRERLSSF